MTRFENPVPVVVGLIPVYNGDIIGLLLVRRGIDPQKDLLALPGGYLEIESWRDGLAREVREETGISIDPHSLHSVAFESSAPHPNRLLVFGYLSHAPSIDDIPPFKPNAEVTEIGVIYRVDGMEDAIAFPLHFDQIAEWLGGTDNVNLDAPVGFHPLPQQA